MKKLKIRIVINTLGGGGAEKVLLNFLRLAPAEKYDITIVELYNDYDAYQLPAFVKKKVVINSPFLKNIRRKLLLKTGQLFSNIILQGKYDLEIAFLEGFPTKIVAKLDTVSPKIAFVHCDVSKTNVMGKLYSSNKKCLEDYSKFKKVCFVSEGAKQGFLSSVGELPQFCVVHNCIDAQEILHKAFLKSDTFFCTNGLKIVAVGRLSEPKCFQRIINIASILEKKYRFEVLIVGEGEKRKELENLILKKRVRSVRLFGFTDNPYPIMNEADLFLCSSIYEGYSTVTIESLILETPVITTYCAGMEEILHGDKYGKIVNNTEQELLKALEDVMKDSSKLSILKEKAKNGSAYYQSVEPTREYLALIDEVICETKLVGKGGKG